MKVRIKKLHPDAVVPTYATAGAACFDLHAIDQGLIGIADEWNMDAKPAVAFRTGLSIEVPAGHVMKVYSRSGHGFKHGVRLSNCTGIIDSDYRGELMVSLRNDGEEPVIVRKGDRIAQAMIIPVEQVQFELADELSDTKRGTGGFGSTGA